MVDLLVTLLVVLLVVGLVYYIAQMFLPDPFPQIVLAIGLVILVIVLIQSLGSLDTGDGDVGVTLIA